MLQAEISDVEYVRKKLFDALHVPPLVWVEQFPEGTVRGSCPDSDGTEVQVGDLVDFNANDHTPAIFLGEKLERDHMFPFNTAGVERLIWYRYFLGPNGLFTADGQWPFRLIGRMAS